MRRQAGLTLLELMVVVVIIAIAASIAAPSFSRMIQHERHARVVNQLQALYKYARSEATKREQVIRLATNNGQLQVLLDAQVLRQLALPLKSSSISVDGLAVLDILPFGAVSSALAISVTDGRNLVPKRHLCVWLSGQLVVQEAACA